MEIDDYRKILRKYWNYPDFRGVQADIIQSIGSGHDTLGLMPTGGGKSITFQVPALALPGICVVVTPLIALMKDQVQHLRRNSINAAFVYSGMSAQEIGVTLDNCILGDVKLLYVSPERLGTSLFQNKIRRMNVSFVTVDEAHCISQWGYDFRPSYLEICKIRDIKPNVPILALTATATLDVVDDIQNRLHFREKNVFRMSFERKNLAYVVRNTSDKNGELIHILKSVRGAAIVYVRNRKHTKEYAKLLEDNGISAIPYHAGLENSIKDERQEAWRTDATRVIVSTNAFGMGIDKPNVRVVIHMDCPNSLEEYFQEAGRSGRDGKKSYAVLLYDNSDSKKLLQRVDHTFPEKEYIKDVYDHLAYFYQIGVGCGYAHTFEFNIDKFCRIYHYFPVPVDSALKILTQCGYLDYKSEGRSAARVKFILTRNELYRLYNNSSNEDSVITALLRCYGGLFADYEYVDEGLLAITSGLDEHQVYLALKALSQKRIIHFIPRSSMPFITYSCARKEHDLVVIPSLVYEQRKEQFVKRIESMIRYATNDRDCRSRQLIEYFGERHTKDCHQCDVCLSAESEFSEGRKASVRKAILDLLDDGNEHNIEEINSLHLPEKELFPIMENLLSEEEIKMNGIYIQKI